MTSSRSVRLVAASSVLAVSGALLAVAQPAATGAPTAPGANAASAAGSATNATADKKKKKRKGKVTWDSTYYAAGAGAVVAHGKVPGGKKKVRLQVKIPGKWMTFAKTKSDRKGKFAISGTLDWYGTHKVRVSTKGRNSFAKRKKVTVVTAYTPRGNAADYTFLTSEGSSRRYTWNPCKTVRYVVNAEDVGDNGILLAQQAMAQVSAATGIKTKYVGTSSILPQPGEATRLPKRQDMIIAWGDENEIPEFQTGPIGLAGPDKAFLGRTTKGKKKVWMTTSASVMLDTTAYSSGNFSQSFIGPKPAWGEVVAHEVGHAFGLGHSPAGDEIMYYQAGNGVWPDGLFRGIYNNGDLAGLAKSGLDQGCVKKVKVRGQDGLSRAIAAPIPAKMD